MIIIELNMGGGQLTRQFLLPGEIYTVGRKDCRLSLPLDDPSISRHHATITTGTMARYSVTDAAATFTVNVEDLSKHGTLVDRELIGRGNARFVYAEDRIRFGRRVSARAIPMTFVWALSPDLPDPEVDEVISLASRIGAYVADERVPSPFEYYQRQVNCLGFLYVAPDHFEMSISMMEALGYGYTLVTKGYLSQLVSAFQGKDTLLHTDFPVPQPPTPGSLALRNVHYRRPAQPFYSVAEFLSVGRPVISRAFIEYTFVLAGEAMQQRYSRVVELFGGSVHPVPVEEGGSVGQQHPAIPFTGTSNVVVVLAEDDFQTVSNIVVEHRKRGSEKLRDVQTDHSDAVIAAYLWLYTQHLCLIPETNVHLALYRDDPVELNTKATACFLQSFEDASSPADAREFPSQAKSTSPSAGDREIVIAPTTTAAAADTTPEPRDSTSPASKAEGDSATSGGGFRPYFYQRVSELREPRSRSSTAATTDAPLQRNWSPSSTTANTAPSGTDYSHKASVSPSTSDTAEPAPTAAATTSTITTTPVIPPSQKQESTLESTKPSIHHDPRSAGPHTTETNPPPARSCDASPLLPKRQLSGPAAISSGSALPPRGGTAVSASGARCVRRPSITEPRPYYPHSQSSIPRRRPSLGERSTSLQRAHRPDYESAPAAAQAGTLSASTTSGSSAALTSSAGRSLGSRLPPKNSTRSEVGGTSNTIKNPSSVDRRLPQQSGSMARKVVDSNAYKRIKSLPLSPPPERSSMDNGRSPTPDDQKPVVVHGPSQLRQRVGAVKLSKARATRVSTTPDTSPRPSDGEGGSTRNHIVCDDTNTRNSSNASPQAALRSRHSIFTRQPIGSAGATNTRAPASSVPTRRYSQSVQYRRIESNNSLSGKRSTPRTPGGSGTYSSVPRSRPGQGSARRQQSPSPRDGISGDQQQQRQRRSSGSLSTVAEPAIPGQIPGLRSNSVMPMANTMRTEGQTQDLRLGKSCDEFMREFLDTFMGDTEKLTRQAQRQGFLNVKEKQFLEDGTTHLGQFLQYVNNTEHEIAEMYSSENTRRSCHQLRQKATYILRKIKGAYEYVHIDPPHSLLRARESLSSRGDLRIRQRYNSVSNSGTAMHRRNSLM